jgi:hypothetical protein
MIPFPADLRSLRIEGQYQSGSSKADIVIRDDQGKCLLIVEAKVDDPVNGFQLQRYRDVPELIGSKAVIISLARMGAHDSLTTKKDLAETGIRFLSWPELLHRLKLGHKDFRHTEVDQFFSFCDCIKLNQRIRTKGASGPTVAELSVLNAIRHKIADWDCEPAERPPNISARLRAGRPEWKRIFGSESYKRLLIYYDV